MLLLAVLPSAAHASSAVVQAGIYYVGLGDSYSSGEGNPPFEIGTDQSGDFCHRSSVAYPNPLSSYYHTAPVLFYACSGARTYNMLPGGTLEYPGEGVVQLDQLGVDTSANLVTLTVGGDDAGFASVLQACITQKLKADVQNGIVGPIGQWLGLGADPSCANSSAFTSSVTQQIQNIETPVQNVFGKLLAKTSGTNTAIIAADYPRIFPDTTAEQTCIQLSPWLTTADQNWMNDEGNTLDTVEQTAANGAGVNMVDVRPLFDDGDHEVCGNGGAWINGMTWNWGDLFSQFPPVQGSFHPNAAGQAGYAQAFENFIDTYPGPLTPQGLPANPPPVTAGPIAPAPAATTAPADSISALSVTPAGVTYPSCEGHFRAGQQVKVTGSGFAPSTTVTVYSSSPGQSSTEQQVGQVTSDSSGAIDTNVTIPVGATGFTVSGTNGGLVGLDAIGTGANGSSHADALNMIPLASRRSICGGATPIAGGEAHTLAVNSDGTVSAFGYNGYGQLGNGTLASSASPVKVTGLSGVSEVTAGDISSYALTRSGNVYSWGDNTFGQLGNGTTTGSTTPVQLTGLSNIMQIAAGNDHVLALNSDGTVEAWGLNNAGQLGNTTSSYSTTPVAVPGLSNVVQVAAGGLPGWAGHSVALKSNGTVWTWGYGKHGQLGQGSATSNPTPTQVSGLSGIVQIAANGDNTYALKSNGTVYAWGDDGYDQIGNTSSANNQVTPLQVQNLSGVSSIAADGTAALAIKTNGTVWAWGDNNTGELGDNAACGKYCVTPVQAIGLSTTGSIAGGYVHSLAETINGNVYGWGSNSYGQLGNGTTNVATEPTQVPNLTAEH